MAKKKKSASLTNEELRAAGAKIHVASIIASGMTATRAQHPVHKIKDFAVEIAATSLIIADQIVELQSYSAKELAGLIDDRNGGKR